MFTNSEEATVQQLVSLKFATDGNEAQNKITFSVKFAGANAADITIGILLTPFAEGGTEIIYDSKCI